MRQFTNRAKINALRFNVGRLASYVLTLNLWSFLLSLGLSRAYLRLSMQSVPTRRRRVAKNV